MQGTGALRAASGWLAAMLLAFPDHVLAQGPQALTQAYNASGEALFRSMAARPGNIVFSPLSIGTAMAMALAGARGETEREMTQVLRHSLPPADVHDASAGVLATLKGYDKSAVSPLCPPGMTLERERCVAKPGAEGFCEFPAQRAGGLCVAAARFAPSAKLLVANALMLSKPVVSQDYAALLKDKYAAEVFRGAGLDTVNGWVSKATEGKIDKIIERMSDVVLVNAVYFKSRWALVFDKTLTKNEFFHLSRTRQELVPTMLQRARHTVAAREGYRAIRLPYSVRSLAMVVALPNEIDGIDTVGQRLDAAELSQTLAVLRKEVGRPVVLSLPRFKIEYTSDLKTAFQASGMTRPFDMTLADFSGMTGVPSSQRPAAIDQIVHRAVIEVQEESTEAAAATAIGMQVASVSPPPPEPVQFRVDRPFLYYIVDDATGAVLFQGRVVDPR
jgi:serpin B